MTVLNQSAASSTQTSPYRGLDPYTESDWQYFFGRERECDIISANLRASRLTLLYGASGAGKTSVLRAGVAHQLAKQARDNQTGYGRPEHAVLVFSAWRDDPVASLQAYIAAAVADALGHSPDQSPPPSTSLVDALPAWSECVGGDVLIILDQFEEYFLYHSHEDGPESFDFQFPRAVNRPDLQVNFLIGIREDALARLDRFKGRVPDLFANYLRLEHLDRTAARQAIERPLLQFNSTRTGPEASIEPALTEAVLDDLANAEDERVETGRGMPGFRGARLLIDPSYLQVVMTRLWLEEVRSGSAILRLQTFEGLGTAHDILQAHLDDTMRSLSDDEQASAAAIFHHLVTPSGSKVAHNARDLAGYANVDQERVDRVLSYLSHQSRILRSIPPFGRFDEPRYEIYHDRLADAVLGWRSRYLRERQLAEEQARSEKQKRAYEAEAARKLADVEAVAAARARRAALFPLALSALYWCTALSLGFVMLILVAWLPVFRTGFQPAPILITLAGCAPVALLAALVVVVAIRTNVSGLAGERFTRLALKLATAAFAAAALLSGLLLTLLWANENAPLPSGAANVRSILEELGVVVVIFLALAADTLFVGRASVAAIEDAGGYDPPWSPPGGRAIGGVPRRAIALVIDLALILAAGFVLLFISAAFRFAYGAVYWVAFAAVVWLYAPLLEAGRMQATVGKRLVGLAVVDERGRPITFVRAQARHFAKLLSWGGLLGGFLFVLLSARRQAIHDVLAGTLVVAPPESVAEPAPSLPEGLVLSGIGRRAIASLVDTTIWLLVTSIPTGLFNQTQRNQGSYLDWVPIIAVGWLYTAGLESSPFQGTLGKMAMGLIVVDARGRRISFWRATGRYFGRFVSCALLFGGYIAALFSTKKQTLHDKFAATLVINARASTETAVPPFADAGVATGAATPLPTEPR